MTGSFDPLIEFDFKGAKNFEDLKSKIGDRGLNNGPRTGENPRTSRSSEAYCMRRWLLRMGKERKLEYPVSLFHLDAPDFIVVENGCPYGVEVTEATVPEDGRERARSEKSDAAVEYLGTHGGRGKDGFMGDEPLKMIFQDIQDAIIRKSGKYSAKSTIDLLLYPNSNPTLVLSHKRELPELLGMPFDRREFRRIFLYWDSETINEI